ncbi:hypothetical protein TSOC_007438 [Tetrabaena socialis]|uniref:Uncharacterized protein n=1 Tax=Tetrabaena socialis TaxID=47790 RepID=A0A2J8A143_9CHLO|nr:hypothetical protein TSOC_007438 [Tetrabaena socialis]|eukprot:PNH06208.1 hypothetical protein TSOC_007438 [Tetrabaena socialis]
MVGACSLCTPSADKETLAPDQVAVTVEGASPAGRAANTPELGPDGRPLPRVLPRPVISCGGWSLTRSLYQNMYGSMHSVHVSVMVHFHSWPFRPDTMYFRMLTLVQLLGIVAVGAIVVLGWVVSTRESTCGKSAKTCNTCLAVHERYFASAEPVCQVMERAVAGIVASTNGTWLDANNVREERYCNWHCVGEFTPNTNSSCPVS